MVSDRSLRAFAQAYRWIIAGLTGAVISQMGEIQAGIFNPITWGFQGVAFVLLLLFAFAVEYWVQGAIDPDIEI